MYTLTDVTKTYAGKHPVTALDRVTITIPDGQMVAIEEFPPAVASRRCCRCWARSTCPPAAR